MALSTRMMFVRAVVAQKSAHFSGLQRLLIAPTLAADSAAVRHVVTPATQSNYGTLSMRFFSTTNRSRCEHQESSEDADDTENKERKLKSRHKPYTFHPVEVSMRYMESSAYAEVYKDEPVWTKYRRNFKGRFEPKTRRTCLVYMPEPYINSASPCPICRDEYLVIHHENTKLLKQFISPYTGEILPTTKTRLCQRTQFAMELEIMKAYDLGKKDAPNPLHIGLIEFDVPFRSYSYDMYYPELKKGLQAEIL